MSEVKEGALNLVDGLFEQMDRVRELITQYEDPLLNGAGKFAAAMMRAEIKAAEEAIKYTDTVKMIQLYQSLKEYKS